METLGVGAFPDGEWECFRRMFAIEENIDDSPQLHGQSSFLLGVDDGNFGIQSMFCSTPEAGGIKSMSYSFDYNNSNLQYVSQESSHSSNCSDRVVFMANPGHTNYNFDCPDVHVLAYNSDRSENSDHSQVEPIVFPTKQSKLKRMLDVPGMEVHVEDKINSCGNPKKKPCASKEVQRCMKNAESKKSQKVDIHGNEAEEINAGSDGQSSSSYHTSEEHNMSEENSGGATSASKLPVALNLNGKTRASRGSATDPQSLYARKRRERINERLRILQNLVPNGTKVDISTMLEEAIHYVKFLQLQIKLLSSEDLWMYAPLAYNGLDIGSLNLSQKISPPL